MVQLEVIRQKVARLRDTTARLHACLPGAVADMVSDRDILDLVSFRAYLIVQDAIDICSHVLADRGWGPAPSLRDHFTLLADKGVLPADLATRLAAAVKVRNLVGHGYAAIDPRKLHEAAGELATLVDPFCHAILSFAEQHPGSGG